MSSPQRPLSPHLQVYRPQISSVMSIMHRISGVGLFVGVLTLIAYLAALASGPWSLACFAYFAQTFLGRVYFFALSVAGFYHAANGLRHLAWDAGKGYDLPTMHKSGYAVLMFTAAACLVFWAGLDLSPAGRGGV